MVLTSYDESRRPSRYDASRHASLLCAFRGLTARQQHLLEMAARARGTYYEDQGLLPWWPSLQRDAWGRIRPIGCHEREPGVQYGLLGQKVQRLLDGLCAEGKLPRIKGAPQSLVDLLMEDLDYVDEVYPIAFDLIVKGSACGGAARIGKGASRRFDPVYIDPVFATPFFPGSVGTEEAQEFAEELDELGIPRDEPDDPRQFLFVPAMARRKDLVALRYMPMWVDRDTGDLWRSRTDYLPNIIVNYRPVKVTTDTQFAPEWIPEDIDPHGWGFIPLVWIKSRGATADDIDGPSLFTPELTKLSYAIDLGQSLRHDSLRNICQPQLTTIDVADKVAAGETFSGLQIPQQESGSGTVMEFESTGQYPSVTVTEPKGTGLAAAKDTVNDFMTRGDQLSGVIEHDQEKAAGALSGVAMEKILAPTVATIKGYQRPITRYTKEIIFVLAQLTLDAVTQKGITCEWPRVISPSPEDIQQYVTAMSRACGGEPVISQETAVGLVAAFLEISDPEKEWARVQAHAEELADRLFGAAGGLPPPQAGKAPTKPGGKPAAKPGGKPAPKKVASGED
ncbi:MAG: hypothetical protein ACEQSX_18510 [Baekduiaceae bacterium]